VTKAHLIRTIRRECDRRLRHGGDCACRPRRSPASGGGLTKRSRPRCPKHPRSLRG